MRGWACSARVREGLRRTAQQLVGRFDEIVRDRGRARAADPADRRRDRRRARRAPHRRRRRRGGRRAHRLGRARPAPPRRDPARPGQGRAPRRSSTAPTGNRRAPGRRPSSWSSASTAPARPRPSRSCANLLKAHGAQPLVCAADTFRAAAVEQLEIWAPRAGRRRHPCARGRRSGGGRLRRDGGGQGAGPRSDHRRHGRPAAHPREPDAGAAEDPRRSPRGRSLARRTRCCSCSTRRSDRTGWPRRASSWPSAGVTGIVLAKLDGTAKGGIAVAIAHDLGLPIRYVGVGEGIDDLVPFSAREYVDAPLRRELVDAVLDRRGLHGARAAAGGPRARAHHAEPAWSGAVVVSAGRRRGRARAFTSGPAGPTPRCARSMRRASARGAPRSTARSSRAAHRPHAAVRRSHPRRRRSRASWRRSRIPIRASRAEASACSREAGVAVEVGVGGARRHAG